MTFDGMVLEGGCSSSASPWNIWTDDFQPPREVVLDSTAIEKEGKDDASSIRSARPFLGTLTV